MSLTDWNYLWRQEGNRQDSLKIKALLAKYLEEEPRGMFSVFGAYPWPAGYKRGPEIKKAFNALFPKTETQTSVTVEQIVAQIKYNLHYVHPDKIHFKGKLYHSKKAFEDRLVKEVGEIYIDAYLELHSTQVYYLHLPSGDIAKGLVDIGDGYSDIIKGLLYNKHALSLPIDKDELSKIFNIIKRETGVDYHALDPNEVIARYKKLGAKTTVNNTWSKQGTLRPISNINETPNDSLSSEQFYSKSELDLNGLSTIKCLFYQDGQSAIQITTSTHEEYLRFWVLAQDKKLPTQTPVKLYVNQDGVEANSYYCCQKDMMSLRSTEFILYYVDSQKKMTQLSSLTPKEFNDIVRLTHPTMDYDRGCSLTGDIIQNIRKHLKAHLPPAINDVHQKTYTIYIPKEGTELISQCLTLLEEFDPSAQDMMSEMRDVLKIERHEVLSKQSSTLDVQSIIEKAINIQDDSMSANEYIWTLANKYYENFRLLDSTHPVTREQLYNIFNGISQKNQYYCRAQESLVELLIEQSKLEKNNIERLNQALVHATNSKNQDLITDVCERLSAFSGKKMEINTIKPNTEMLPKLADGISSCPDTFFPAGPVVVSPQKDESIECSYASASI